jgi:hypothetical protein
MLAFQGSAFSLSPNGLARACDAVGVHAQEIWTILHVETLGCGFLSDRRPSILYERHIFHRLTHGAFDDGDISDLRAGGYGAEGAQQYNRLARAMSKDSSAALKSTSWGIGQILGENFADAGFGSVEEMVKAMSGSEDDQLAAMAGFLNHSGLAKSLQAHDWTTFARGYNGPNYAINRYDVRLNGEFQKFDGSALPDLEVRAIQLYLTYLDFQPGPIDGIAGVHTLGAYAQFAAQNGIPFQGTLDGALDRLRAALPAIS